MARILETWKLGDADRVYEVAAALLQAGHSWASLTATKVTNPDNYCVGSTVAFQSALYWLLCNAKGLRFVRLELKTLRCMPRLAQLRHLQLYIYDGTGNLGQSLSNLRDLQTLYLKQDADLFPVQSPVLALTGLSQLRSVKLSNVVPASLALPLGAALHLRLRSMEDAHAAVWNSCVDFLQSVHVRDRTDAGCLRNASELPDFMSGPSVLETIVLRLKRFGAPEEPAYFSQSLLQARRLVLQCTDELRIHIPSEGLQWGVVTFASMDVLEVTFDDISLFLLITKAFSFAYTNLQGLALMYLSQAMAEQGIQICCDTYNPTGCALYSTPALYSESAYDDTMLVSLCNCGACPECSDKGSCGPDAAYSRRHKGP